MIHWKRKQFWIWKNKPLKNLFPGKLSMNLCQSVRLDYTFHTFRILSFTGMKWMGRVVCLNAFLFQILYSKWFIGKMFKIALKYTKCTIPDTPFKIMIPLYCMYGCILVYRGLVWMSNENVHKLANGTGIKPSLRVKANAYCLDFLQNRWKVYVFMQLFI